MERPSRAEQWQLGELIDTSFVSAPSGQSALDYFSDRFQSGLKPKLQRYQGFAEAVVIGAAEMYGRMVPLVMEARSVLENEVGESGMLDTWQEATGTTRMAYQTVLTDVVAQSCEMRLLHSARGNDPETYEADCHNAVLWLGGWLRAENTVD